MIGRKTMFQAQIGFALALLWVAAFGISGALSVDMKQPAGTGMAQTHETRAQWMGLRQAVFGRDRDQREELRPSRVAKTAVSRS
jgi:hypothetical protein